MLLKDFLNVVNFDTMVYVVEAETDDLCVFGAGEELYFDNWYEQGLEELLKMQVVDIRVHDNILTVYIDTEEY